jgi:hypothetical protein
MTTPPFDPMFPPQPGGPLGPAAEGTAPSGRSAETAAHASGDASAAIPGVTELHRGRRTQLSVVAAILLVFAAAAGAFAAGQAL